MNDMKRLIRSIVSVMAFFAIIFIWWLCYAQEESYTTLLKWRDFIVEIKKLAGNSVATYTGADEKIKHFEKAEELTTVYTTWIISIDWENPVYARFDTWSETLYYWVNSGVKIYTNLDSSSMFRGLSKLESLDLSNFDTSNVTDMNQMFNGCKSLTSLDLSNFDTSKVTNMQWMFNSCQLLTSLDLSSFDTSKVTNMQTMFYGCKSLTSLDLSSFDTSKVTNMQTMFAWINASNEMSLETIYVSDLFVTTKVTNSTNMFRYDTNLVWWKWTTYNSWKIDKEYARIDEGPTSENPWYFSVVPVENSILISWKDFNKIIKDLSNEWTHDYSSVNNNIKAIKRKNELPSSGYREVSISGVINPVYVRYDNSDNTIYYYSDSDTIYMNADSSYMFSNLTALETVDLSAFVTSGVETMEWMFNACHSLTELDIGNFDTSKVENMHLMFNACYDLTELDLSNFNTSKVKDMHAMFNACHSLTELNVSNFNTNNVTSMESMFSECQSLTELDLSNFDTSKVENMHAMFNACRKLETLDLSNFDTSSVTNMQTMFYDSKELTTLNLSNFDTINVTNMTKMFSKLPNLTTIYVSDKYKTDNVAVDDMFSEDVKLIWWNWTKFSDLEVVDKTYALIDSVSQSWYFTDVNNITVNFIDEDGNALYTTWVSKWDIISELTSDEIERQTGYSLGYYSDSWMTLEFDLSQSIIKYTEIYTQWTINQYTIIFVKWNWEDDYVITLDYWADITPPTEPTRDWYTFQWRDKDIPTTMPAENITITAQWEAKKQSGGWYSWWWGRRYDDLEQESVVNEEMDDELGTTTDNQQDIDETQAQDSTQIVHDWAYKNWLTKYSDSSDARFWDYLIRSEMAKISSIFATKMLWEKPDESKQDFCSQLTDLSKLDEETRSYIIESCELWYMWYESNWVDGLVKFRPYSSMVLAEASVIISRMMWWNQNAADGEDWYKWHLYASYNHELIDDIRDPFRNITRWEAFEMFYRVFQSKQN